MRRQPGGDKLRVPSRIEAALKFKHQQKPQRFRPARCPGREKPSPWLAGRLRNIVRKFRHELIFRPVRIPVGLAPHETAHDRQWIRSGLLAPRVPAPGRDLRVARGRIKTRMPARLARHFTGCGGCETPCRNPPVMNSLRVEPSFSAVGLSATGADFRKLKGYYSRLSGEF